MTFAQFAKYLQILESTSSRLAMTEQLVELFGQLSAEEIQIACYLLQGQLVPSYQSLEFQMSVKMVLRALTRIEKDEELASQSADLFGQAVVADPISSSVNASYKKLGDVGLVAEQVLSTVANNKNRPEPTPSIEFVYQQLINLAKKSGEGSQEDKVDILSQLLKTLDPLSTKFVCRIIIGKLRLGFSTMTMLDALSWLVAGDKSLTSELEEAYQKRADLGELAQVVRRSGSLDKLQIGLSEYSVKVGVPVVPALCQRLNSAAEIIDKLGAVLAEPKYDGLRVQIHIWRGGSIDNRATDSSEIPDPTPLRGLRQVWNDNSRIQHDEVRVRVFTRNLEDATHMFPELLAVAQSLNCQSCVLDAEAIGFDPATGLHKTFQETITRKRKHNIDQATLDVPLRFYIFDLLELDGQPLIDLPLTDRKKYLAKLLASQNDILCLTESITFSDPEKLHAYHEKQLSLGLEGMVAKAVDSQYRPGRKGWRWVKIKEPEGSRGKLADTLDVVVMGYYKGRGKRTQFGLGALLVGIVDDQSGEPKVLSISKIGTGLSEEQLSEFKALLDDQSLASRPPEFAPIDKSLEPDVWVAPQVVIEVAADEITESPVHAAGFALRFPRLIKIRRDKTWQQGTSMNELAGITQSK